MILPARKNIVYAKSETKAAPEFFAVEAVCDELHSPLSSSSSSLTMLPYFLFQTGMNTDDDEDGFERQQQPRDFRRCIKSKTSRLLVEVSGSALSS
jgi:hypothetical protein